VGSDKVVDPPFEDEELEGVLVAPAPPLPMVTENVPPEKDVDPIFTWPPPPPPPVVKPPPPPPPTTK